MSGFDIAMAILTIGSQVTSQMQMEHANWQRQQEKEVERKIQLNRQKQQKRNMLREARLKRAAAVSEVDARQGGVGRTSAAHGQIGGLESQYSYNLSFLDTQKSLNQQAFEFNKQADAFDQSAANWSMASDVFSYVGSKSDALGLGKKPSKPSTTSTTTTNEIGK